MRLVSIQTCEEGLFLAKPVLDENNRILLNEGVQLTPSILDRLKQKQVNHIYVKSSITEGVQLKDDISPGLRLQTTRSMAKAFQSLTEENSKLQSISQQGKAIRELKAVYEQLLKEMNRSPNLVNLLTNLRTGTNRLFEHSLNVSIYALTVGRQMGIREADMYALGLGAMFHDIGKTKLDPRLSEKETLTNEELQEIRKHPDTGFQLLRNERELNLLVAHCAYQHHEHYDGTGYPRQLKKNDIHLLARIIAVANLFDKLTHPVNGAKSLLPHEAMEVMMGHCYTMLDPKVLEAFRKSIAIYPVGVTVTLNTGVKGVVVSYNRNSPQRPKIRVFTDTYGNRIEGVYEVDLLEELNLMIVACDAILDDGKRLVQK